jgi:outer membrane protein OmpA-like peptidoglycan-associated protein
MKRDTAHHGTSTFMAILKSGALRVLPVLAATLSCALLVACATPPPSPPAPVPAARVMTRGEVIAAALKALDFEPKDDGFHLSLPAPLVFSFDSDSVAPTARVTLVAVGRELQELAIDRTLVRGHTDNVGTNDYNLGLSKRRADAVAKMLVEGGYPAEKIDAKGLASSVPVADNSTAEGRAKNRRVVIIVQLQ